MAKRRSVRIDMTAMVDVAFLLLIFFMSTTQFRPPEQFAVNLPTSTADVRVPETDTIILTVTKDGRTFISSERGSDIMEVPRVALLDALLNWRSRNPGAVVVLKGDRDAAFGSVADLMDALAASKTLRFNLMTDLEREGGRARRRGAREAAAGAEGAEGPGGVESPAAGAAGDAAGGAARGG